MSQCVLADFNDSLLRNVDDGEKNKFTGRGKNINYLHWHAKVISRY